MGDDASEQSVDVGIVLAVFRQHGDAGLYARIVGLTHLIDIHREWRRRVPAEVGSSMSLADIAHLLTSSDHVHLFMQDLADMVGLSPVTFRRRFTGACGCSPSRYRQRHRLQCTAELLEQGLAVQEVAQRLGYSNPFGFSNQFHRHMRCRPRRD